MAKPQVHAWIAAATLLAASPSAAIGCEMAGRGALAPGWQEPIAPDVGRRTSGFAMLPHPILGAVRLHTGLDWAAPIGTPVVAAAVGRVIAAGRDGEYGIAVRIDHGDGWETLYAHLQRVAAGIEPGACVTSGKQIGAVGNTGLSAGPHLHFEVRSNGQPLDPMTLRE